MCRLKCLDFALNMVRSDIAEKQALQFIFSPAKMFVERDELTSMGDLFAQPSFVEDDSVAKPRIEKQ